MSKLANQSATLKQEFENLLQTILSPFDRWYFVVILEVLVVIMSRWTNFNSESTLKWTVSNRGTIVHSGLRNTSCRFYIWSVFILSSKVWPWEYSIGENLTMDIYLFFVKLVKNLLSFDLKFTRYIFLETPKVKSHEIEVPTRCMAALGTRISRIEIHGWMFLMARILTLNDILRLYCLQWMAVRDSEDLSFC